MEDKARMTVRQTTELTQFIGAAHATERESSYARDMEDKARTTTKETTLLEDYVGVATGMVENKVSHDAAYNMEIDERREISTYNRAANGKEMYLVHILIEKMYI
jgi:phage anti-repressor protein